MICMGYNDPHSVYNKRCRIAAILGTNDALDGYIKGIKGETP